MKPRFRAWDVLAEKMIDEILMISFVRKEIIGKFSDGSTSVPLKFEDERNGEDVILMQSTGLKDKNGKEIFDGDIVRTTRFLGRADEIGGFYEYEKDYVGVVKVLEGSWVIDTGIVAVRLWSEIDESEVLGNIYENPELLEDKK
ncbi:MAG: YopX family protein [Enterococcus faecalis]|nr:YopX family protein [Enterococcus faecalis]